MPLRKGPSRRNSVPSAATPMLTAAHVLCRKCITHEPQAATFTPIGVVRFVVRNAVKRSDHGCLGPSS